MRFVFCGTIIRWNIVVVTVFLPFNCSEIDEKRGGQITWIKEHKTFPDSNPRGHSFWLCDFEQVTSFSEPISSSLKCKKDRTYLERSQWGLKMAESLSKGNMSARRHLGARNRKASQTGKHNEGHLLDGVTEKSQWVLIQGWKRNHVSFYSALPVSVSQFCSWAGSLHEGPKGNSRLHICISCHPDEKRTPSIPAKVSEVNLIGLV